MRVNFGHFFSEKLLKWCFVLHSLRTGGSPRDTQCSQLTSGVSQGGLGGARYVAFMSLWSSKSGSRKVQLWTPEIEEGAHR